MGFQYKRILKRIGLFAAVLISVLAGVFISIRLAFFLLPFLIAFALSTVMEPLIKLIHRKLRISRKIAAPVVLLLLLAIIAVVVVLVISKLIKEIKALIVAAPGFLAELYQQITHWLQELTVDLTWLPPEITEKLGDVTQALAGVISNLSNTITNFGKAIVKGAFTTAISFPEMLIFAIITIMATYFMAKDRDKIASLFARHLPKSWLERILSIRKDMFSALFGYLRSALIIMCITFAELFIGFTIMRLQYSLLLAFVIAIIDALPILGTGGVVLPWSLYSFITGNIKMGFSLLVLYLVVLVIRQIIEPKILGQQIGVHPLVTLIAMYTGLKLAGFIGLIIGPITYLLIRNIMVAIYKNKTLKDIIGIDDTESSGKTEVKPPTATGARKLPKHN